MASQIYPANRHDFDLDSNFYPKQPCLIWSSGKISLIIIRPLHLIVFLNRIENKLFNQLFRCFLFEIPRFSYPNPTTSFVKINGDSLHPLIISDAIKHSIYFLNRQLEIKDSVHYGPVVDIDFTQDKMLACDIGVLNPNNGKFGKAQFINE